MQFITNNYDKILEAIGAINVIFTFLGLVTPSNKKKTIISSLGRVCDRLGINIKGK